MVEEKVEGGVEQAGFEENVTPHEDSRLTEDVKGEQVFQCPLGVAGKVDDLAAFIHRERVGVD
jgi:hypothetical protein